MQKETLLFCKSLGCRIIVVHENEKKYPKHIFDAIDNPDFSCVKNCLGVFGLGTEPLLFPYLEKNNVTSLVLMGGHIEMCVRSSLIGSSSFDRYYSGHLEPPDYSTFISMFTYPLYT